MRTRRKQGKGTKIAQDEREDQVKAIVYGDDIPKRMKLYRTYCIIGARVQPPYLKNEKSVHAFNWVLDKRSIIDSVKKRDIDALPLSTKLNAASFQDIKHHVLRTTITDTWINEFDILAIVVICAPPRYAPSVEKRIQELIVMNTSKETLTLTIWEEEIIEQEGGKLLHQFRNYPVILARRVGASKYNGVSLTTKFRLIHFIHNAGNSKNGPLKIWKCLLPLPAEVHLDLHFSYPFQWTKKWYLLQTLTHNKMVKRSE